MNGKLVDLTDRFPEQITQEIKQHPEFIWFRARAIDADIPDDNGDIFPEKEILSEIEVDGTRMLSFQTFVGRPILTRGSENTKNGEIIHAEWDDKDKCVYVISYVNSVTYPHLARDIINGYKTVAMICDIQYGVCSVCGNKAMAEEKYCEHLIQLKGHFGVYEENFGICFTGLYIYDSSFGDRKIEEILNI